MSVTGGRDGGRSAVFGRMSGVFARHGRPARLTRSLGRALVDLVLPPVCPACRAPVGSAPGLCLDCWTTVTFFEEPWCERLGTPLPVDLGPGTLSAEAVATPPVFGRSRAAVAYDGVVPRLVQAFKYGDRLDLAPMFAAWTARAGRDLLADCDLVVPVPLHRWRLLGRRYNQAAVLAARLARLAGRPYRPLVLVRRRSTRRQVGLSQASRAQNMAGAFAVPGWARSSVKGRRVLLVDDVYTTGATVSAACRALLRAGASQVDVLTLARVV